VLDHESAVALRNLAAGAGTSNLLVGGFGDAAGTGDQAALQLAVARARRLADALTAAGIPAANIRLVAAAAGSGGFVQLVY
jgi:outer membrane protein OmpA-like peptidoglycan-associated protein